MNNKNIIAVVLVSLTLTGCGLYKKYESKAEIPAGVMGVKESTSAPEMTSWRQFFTDPLLQHLIEQALANNTNLASARIAVEQRSVLVLRGRCQVLTLVPSRRPIICRCR